MFKNIKKTLADIVARAILSISLIISSAGCSSVLERNCFRDMRIVSQENIDKEVEIARQRDGVSEEGWNYQTRLYAFQKDSGGEWQPPLVTIIKKSGDCEDIATLSAWYSGHIYGENILILHGRSKEAEEPRGHALHLLKKDGKYGSRGNYKGDTFPAEYSSLKELIQNIQKRRNEMAKTYGNEQIEYRIYAIFDLKDIDKNWRTTNKNLLQGYLNCCGRGKGEGGAIIDLE